MAAPVPTNVLFTFRMIPMISSVLAKAGIDAAALLAEAKLPTEALRGEITAPLARIQRFVDLVARAINAPLFGLDLAERIPTGAYGITEFLVRTSPSVEVGLSVLCEFAPLINPIGEFTYEHTAQGEGELHYRVTAQRDTLGVHLNEYSIAFIVRQVGMVLGRDLTLARVWFSHARTTHADDIAKRFRCPVRFQAPDCGFAVSREELAQVPRTADAPLFEFLHAQARAQMSRIGSVDMVTQVMRVVEMRLAHGDVSASAVASAMATTVRSLQRHLADAGTTYRDVLAHVRTRRLTELRHAGLAEAEIAKQLGFADARSMRRLFDEQTAAAAEQTAATDE